MLYICISVILQEVYFTYNIKMNIIQKYLLKNINEHQQRPLNMVNNVSLIINSLTMVIIIL